MPLWASRAGTLDKLRPPRHNHASFSSRSMCQRGRSPEPATANTEETRLMTTISRRTFLKTSGALGAAAVLGEGLRAPAHADKPISFSGWVFKPDTVKDYVNFYNQKYQGQVKYEAIPWAQYHPTMETRALAGEVVDVMYCNHNNRERWFENGLIRAVDDLPGTDELKKKMTPANLDSLKSKDGTKLLGLPYFTSLFILIYNEPMLQQAGIKAPAKSWDELVEHSMKLKKDKIGMYPGNGSSYMWTDSYVVNAKTKVLEDAWKLTRFLGGNLHGDWYVQRQWCLISGLDNPYPEMYDHAEIIQSYDRWIDLKLLREQYKKGKVIAAYKEPWYGEHDTKAVATVQNIIRGVTTVPKGLKELVALQKSLA